MGIEIILDEGDLRHVRKPRVGDFLEQVCVIHGGVAIGYLDVPPTFQRCEQHEQIGRAISLILVIMPRRAAWLRRHRHTRFGDQLLRGLVQANDGAFGVARPVIHVQHIFHIGDEGSVGLRRNDILLFQMWFQIVFFSVRPIVLSLARSTMFSSTTLSSSSRKDHFARPFGGGEHIRAISLASAVPSKIRRRAEFGECLRARTPSKPSSTSRWRVRKTVASLVSRAFTMRLSLQPSPASEASALSRIRAFSTRAAGCLPLLISASSVSRSSMLNRTMYFLTATSDMCRFPVTLNTVARESQNPFGIKDAEH